MNQLFTQTTFMFLFVAYIGILAHVIVKWLKNELQIPPMDYLFRVNQKASALMFLGTCGGIATGVLTQQFTDIQNSTQILAAWAIGYMADSALNRQQ